MNVRRSWAKLALLGVVCVAWLLRAPLLTHADEAIQIVANEHSLKFGEEIRFHLEVRAEATIRSIVLAYRASSEEGTIIETLSFLPDTRVTAEHVHHVAERYVRPFARITYWWTIETVDGARLTSEPISFAYADNRFQWQTLSSAQVHVHWYRGEVETAQKALDAALQGLDRARLDVPIESLERSIEVYLYDGDEDMVTALPHSFPPAVAVTLPDDNVILVARAPVPNYVAELKRVLPHEVTHALLYQAVRGAPDRIPTWLSEGLAMSVQYDASEPDPDAALLVQQAIAERRMLPFDALCGGFPHEPEQVRLAYAQSASVVAYIRGRYGRQALRDLIAAYGDGATCKGGVQRVLGLSLDQLSARWSAHVGPQSGWAIFWRENGVWIVLLVLLTLLPLALALPRPKSPAAARAGESTEGETAQAQSAGAGVTNETR